MKPKDDRDRIVKIAIGFGVACLVLACGFIVIGSYEIAKIKESIAVASENNKVDPEEISKKVASLIKVPKARDGIDCSKCLAIDGKNGKDSLSTQTIIERQTNTVIQKELPPINGKDGQNAEQVEFAFSGTGKLLWKYESDREWRLIPTIEVNL